MPQWCRLRNTVRVEEVFFLSISYLGSTYYYQRCARVTYMQIKTRRYLGIYEKTWFIYKIFVRTVCINITAKLNENDTHNAKLFIKLNWSINYWGVSCVWRQRLYKSKYACSRQTLTNEMLQRTGILVAGHTLEYAL